MANYKNNLYHIAINQQGYVLSGAPHGVLNRKFSRSMGEAPVNGAEPTQFDAEYQDASAYLPWAQIDFSGGFQFDKWLDNAGFENGSGLEYIKKYKEVTLLNDKTLVKDFGASFTFGAAIQYNRDTLGLLIGVTKAAGASQLWGISTSNALTQITVGWSNVNAVNAMDEGGGKAFIGCTVSAGSPLKSYDTAGGLADITLSGALPNSANTIVRMVKRVGMGGSNVVRIYVGGYTGTALSGDALIYSDDLGVSWTDLVKKTGTNRQIIAGVDNLGTLYYLIQDGGRTELWWANDTTVTQVYVWNNLTSPTIQSWLGKVYIMGFEAGQLRRFVWNGAQMNTVFEQKLPNTTPGNLDLDASPMVVYLNNLLSYGMIYDGSYNFPSYNFKFSGNKNYPFAVFGAGGSEVPYFYGLNGTSLQVSRLNTAVYQSTGNFYTGLFAAKKWAVDKMWANITLSFKELTDGQTIVVDSSIDGEATWVNVGTVTHTAGETERTLYFPSNTISKRIQLRFTLTGDTTATPTLYSYVARFLVLPDVKNYWTFRLDCRDKLMLLDGKTIEPKKSIELRNIIMNARVAKQNIELQDVDFAENTLDGLLSATATTIKVKDTTGFPEQGRIKIEQEEILYSSIDSFNFMGCTRAARGTKALSHADTTRVSNAYNIVLQNVAETNIVMAQAKIPESVLSITCIEL